MNRKARIMFVDDEKRVLNAMRGLFRRHHELFLANSGAEAIQLAEDNDIDVVVCDQRMPGMTGVEVLGKIKQHSPRTVRILLTGYADASAIEGSINVGEVFRFLSKPCPPAQLKETLKLAVEASDTTPVAPLIHPVPFARPAPVEETPPAPAAISDSDATEPALRIIDESSLPPPAAPEETHWQTVTNVVMSEDTVSETQNLVPSMVSRPPVPEVGIVVFTVDSEFAATVIRAVSTERDTTIATTLIKVAETIAAKKAGVLVTDFTANKQILQKIIGALKQRLPELVTITVSDGRDSEDMINLINYGQVFRYVVKPVEPDRIRNDINAAAVQHSHLLHNPKSAKRHQVVETEHSTETSSSVDKFLGKIRSASARST